MQKLEIIIGNVKTVSEELAQRTIAEIEEARADGKTYTLVCAKGSSAKEYYAALKQSGFDFRDVTAFAIDQDLGKSNDPSPDKNARKFLEENLPEGIQIQAINADFLQDGVLVDNDLFAKMMAANPGDYARIGREITLQGVDRVSMEIRNAIHSYNQIIAQTGRYDDEGLPIYRHLNLAIIGLGVNPLHMGSNFPQTDPKSSTHLGEKLDKDGNVVGYAMTMGISTLCSAEQAILFAAGESKAEGLKKVLEGPITEQCPPSYLRNMNDLTLALDPAAASKLDLDRLKEMYQDRQLVVR